MDPMEIMMEMTVFDALYWKQNKKEHFTLLY